MPVAVPPEMLRRATELATNVAAQRLNLSSSQLSADVHAEIGASVQRALETQLVGTFEDAAREAVVELRQPPELSGRLSSKLAIGKQIVEMVTADGQFLDILRKNAEMQKAKFDAYVTAGFTEDQAFRLLEAEVLGKAGARAVR